MHCYERERSPWGMRLAQLKSPQIGVNKNAEMIMEGHLYGDDAPERMHGVPA